MKNKLLEFFSTGFQKMSGFKAIILALIFWGVVVSVFIGNNSSTSFTSIVKTAMEECEKIHTYCKIVAVKDENAPAPVPSK